MDARVYAAVAIKPDDSRVMFKSRIGRTEAMEIVRQLRRWGMPAEVRRADGLPTTPGARLEPVS